jgi:hypothetical protein
MKKISFFHLFDCSWNLSKRCPAAKAIFLLVAACIGALTGCGGAGTVREPPSTLTVTLGSSMVLAPQDGTPTVLTVSVRGASTAVTISVTGLPTGVTAQVVPPSGPLGTITIKGSAAAAAGTYNPMVLATDGAQSANKPFTLLVAVSVVIGNSIDTSQGIAGHLQQAMSTSFQPAAYDANFFVVHPDVSPLTTLAPQHIRIQGISEGVPMKSSSNPPQPSDWDFSTLDAIVQPVLGAADHSPEFQVAVAPAFMNDANGHLDLANHLQDFALYCANIVRYYNAGGFDWGGRHFQSASAQHITWWGIFNEYNLNGLTAAQYVQLYDTVVPVMQAVDSTIKFSALELSDFDSGAGDPRAHLPTFVAAKNNGGVNAQVDVVSTHFYSSCNQSDPDAALFNNVSNFAADVVYFRQELQSRADLASVPVWVTENNVNADFDAGNNQSACNPGHPFVTDVRGTSGFFAAWRPFVFSRLGKAGNQALYHWDYDADQQYGEVSFASGNKYLSYWVDEVLGQLFPAPAGGVYPAILTLADSEALSTATLEFLATKNTDGSIVVMVANRAVRSAADNNGPGDPRTTVIDVSALGNFSSAMQINIDASTDLTNGPQWASITPAAKFSITQAGYGVTFIALKP